MSLQKSADKSLQTDTSKKLISLQKAQIKQRHRTQVKTEMTHPWYPCQMSQPTGNWSARGEDGNETKGVSVWTTTN